MMNLLMKFPYVSVILIATFVVAIYSNNAFAQCEVEQMTAPKGDEGYGFASVAIDGDVLAIGDSRAFGNLGGVYVYRRGPGGPGDWLLEATLMSPDPDPEDSFGNPAVSKDVIVVGAHAAFAPELQRGATYVYRYNGVDWNYETTLTASDGDMGDVFGRAVSIDGNYILISAPVDENDGVPQSGSAYVFRYDGANWVEEVKLIDPKGEQGDFFGGSVSLRCDHAIIGAPGNDDAGFGTGAAFIFRYDPNESRKWILEQQLSANDAGGNDKFGSTVSLGNGIALVGAPQQDSQNGAAYVFEFNGKQWIQEIKLVPSEPVGPFPLFGKSLSLSGDILVVGSPHDFSLGGESGAAYVFHKTTAGWSEVAKLTPADGEAGDFFGVSAALDKDIGFIGTNRQNNTQTVYVFDLDASAADMDCNGVVDLTDLMILLGAWGPCADCANCNADLDGNCVVSTSDLLILFANWG